MNPSQEEPSIDHPSQHRSGPDGHNDSNRGAADGDDLPGVRAACDSTNPPLRLDLSGLRSADMDGIRALRSLSETGAELQGASPYIRELLLAAD